MSGSFEVECLDEGQEMWADVFVQDEGLISKFVLASFPFVDFTVFHHFEVAIGVKNALVRELQDDSFHLFLEIKYQVFVFLVVFFEFSLGFQDLYPRFFIL